MKNKIEDLRNHLFEMLENIKDKEVEVDLERYKLGADIAQTIINSAKAEVDFMKVTGAQVASTFIHAEALPKPSHPRLTSGEG